MVEQDENEQRRSALTAAVEVLNERERLIFETRHLADEPESLEELADRFDARAYSTN